MNLNYDLTELIGTMEEVIEMTGINKKYVMPNSNKKEIPKENEDKETIKLPPPKKENFPECYNCKEKGHKRPDCPHPRKIHNMDCETDTEEDDPHPLEVVLMNDMAVISADLGSESSINVIQGDSNLPQKWNFSEKIGHTSDAKMLTIKSEEGNFGFQKQTKVFLD